MKKLLLIILLFILPFTFLTAEEVVLDTPFEDEITIEIPDTQEEMRQLIIDVSELYWGERYDLEKSQEHVTRLEDNIDKLNQQIDQLKKRLEETEKLLDEKVKPDIFRWGINVSGGIMLPTNGQTLTFSALPYIQLFETVNIGIEVGYPLEISGVIGVYF